MVKKKVDSVKKPTEEVNLGYAGQSKALGYITEAFQAGVARKVLFRTKKDHEQHCFSYEPMEPTIKEDDNGISWMRLD